jgi:translocator assembly and maintenance protein 41
LRKKQCVKGSQIDIIIAVNNTREWHKSNYALNKSDYCKKGYFFLQTKSSDYLTKINYISYLKDHNNTFKIGVISKSNMEDDLINWRHGLIAGRFQKPIELIKSDSNLENAIKINRLNALRSALILLSQTECQEIDLYKTICSLSYKGDIRVRLGFENPHKIDNIVNGSFDEFRSIYSSLNDGFYQLNDNLEINTSKLLREVNQLPITLQDYLLKYYDNLDDLSVDDIEMLKFLINQYFNKLNFKLVSFNQ